MSSQVIRSDSSKDGTPEDCLQSYQYVWMSHWTQTRLRSVNHVHNQLSTSYESGENSCRNKLVNSLAGPEIEPDASKFIKEFRETNKVLVTESSTRTCNILRPVTLKSKKHFPMFKPSQYTEGNLFLKIGESSGHQQRMPTLKLGPVSVCDASYDPTDNSKPDIQLTETLFHPQENTSVPGKQAKHDRFLDERRVGVSSLARDELLGSTPADVLLEFNSTRTPVESFSPINRTSTSFLVHEGKMGKNTHDPETSKSCHGDFLGQQFHNMTSHVLPPIRPMHLHHGLSKLPRITSSVLGKGTMRICTTIDAGGPSKFSQTTRHIFIKEDAGLNLSNGVQILEESISTKFKREPPTKVLSFSPGLGFSLKQGVKLQSLDSSTESEGKDKNENVRCAVDSKNESSAETETMDMDVLQENCLLDVAQSVAHKDIKEDVKPPTSEGVLNSVNNKSRASTNLMLPDINVELPPISSDASSTDDENTSTSKTQSMGASVFLTHAEYPTNLKSNVCTTRPLELDPCSRWVKRLKSCSSLGVAHGTKSSEMAEASSHEKVNKIFKKMLYFGKSSEEHVEIDQAVDLQRNVESTSVGSLKAGQEKLLSHAWMRRWCHNPASVASREPLMNSKAIQNNIYKEKYPSLAAMALMGKAMSGFRSCELRREGSCMVWNA